MKKRHKKLTIKAKGKGKDKPYFYTSLHQHVDTSSSPLIERFYIHHSKNLIHCNKVLFDMPL